MSIENTAKGQPGLVATLMVCALLLVLAGCPPERIGVPNVTGMTRADAESTLAGVGLAVGVVTAEYDAGMPAGHVLLQDPPADTCVARGSQVGLVLSLGPAGEGEGEGEAPEIASFAIDDGAASTALRSVLLTNTCTGTPSEFMASESADFAGASWQPYAAAPPFLLSQGNGTKTVYFKVRNAWGEAASTNDTIAFEAAPGAPIVTLYLKENAGTGASEYPVSAVVPLPRGEYFDPAALAIVGTPSQVEAMNRWPDESLRHVLVHFQASVDSFGSATFTVAEDAPVIPTTPVSVAESGAEITVTTGPLRFTVSKTHFSLLDTVWRDANGDGAFDDGERIVLSNAQNGGVFAPRTGAGGVQYDTERSGLDVRIEERGPMRAVIRVEAPADFESVTHHTHGFAARIYAYANKPYVKIDYQLQNSAKNVARSWPLYFESMDLDFRLNLSGAQSVRFGCGNGSVFRLDDGSGGYLAQESHNRFRIYTAPATAVYDSGTMASGTGPEGFVDVSTSTKGVMAAVRNFWQMWPNGLAVDAGHRLSLQLFPEWSAQWINAAGGDTGPGHLSETGLYWVDDMQHVYKEAWLYFHGPDAPDAELAALARTFQAYPTVTPATAWFQETRATLDLGGVVPPDVAIPSVEDRRAPIYHTEGIDPADWCDPASPYYGAGCVNFHDPESGYRSNPSTPGGWPYSAAHMVATLCPGDYFEAEAHAQGELNLRPEWMAQYRHDTDWVLLRLTENPYDGGRWRIFEGHGVSKFAAAPIPNTVFDMPAYGARDDQHGWFYHVAEYYLLSGNPWIRDWYEFVAEFRRVRLERLDPYPDTCSRATGHALNHVVQAYRVTGDTAILARLAEHVRTYLRPEQDPYYGDQREAVEPSGGGFQTGYLMRAIVDYLEEVRFVDAQAYAEGFNYLSGLMEWNLNFGHFPYYFNAREGGHGQSSGTGLTLVDPQAWYYWHTGKQAYLDQLEAFLSTGIDGGETPYGQFGWWGGQWEGRYYLFVKYTPRDDVTPPPPVGDLVATRSSGGIDLAWTAPADAVRYHVVWSTKPISAVTTTDPAKTNWWAAQAVGPALAPTPGARQTLHVSTGEATPVYAALFTFDASDNMSAMSNVVSPEL